MWYPHTGRIHLVWTCHSTSKKPEESFVNSSHPVSVQRASRKAIPKRKAQVARTRFRHKNARLKKGNSGRIKAKTFCLPFWYHADQVTGIFWKQNKFKNWDIRPIGMKGQFTVTSKVQSFFRLGEISCFVVSCADTFSLNGK